MTVKVHGSCPTFFRNLNFIKRQFFISLDFNWINGAIIGFRSLSFHPILLGPAICCWFRSNKMREKPAQSKLYRNAFLIWLNCSVQFGHFLLSLSIIICKDVRGPPMEMKQHQKQRAKCGGRCDLQIEMLFIWIASMGRFGTNFVITIWFARRTVRWLWSSWLSPHANTHQPSYI